MNIGRGAVKILWQIRELAGIEHLTRMRSSTAGPSRLCATPNMIRKSVKSMDDIEVLIESLRTVYASLEKLKQMSGPEMLLPGRVQTYHSALEDAYAAYGRVETRVEALGLQLEVEHQRLDLGVKQYGPTDEELRGL